MSGALIKTGDTSFDKIYAYYLNPEKITLSSKQSDLKKRWLAAWTCLLDKKGKTEVAQILIDTFGIKRAQAFKDVQYAERLFGKVMVADRLGAMALQREYAKECLKLALDAGDYKAAKGFLTEMRECLPFDDDIKYNPEKLEYKPIKISVPKLVIDRILNQGNSGVLDFNKVVDSEAVIIEDEEE